MHDESLDGLLSEEQIRERMGEPRRSDTTMYPKKDLGKRPMSSQSLNRVMMIGGIIIGLGFLGVLISANWKSPDKGSAAEAASTTHTSQQTIGAAGSSAASDTRAEEDDAEVHDRYNGGGGLRSQGRRVVVPGSVDTTGSGEDGSAGGADAKGMSAIDKVNEDAKSLPTDSPGSMASSAPGSTSGSNGGGGGSYGGSNAGAYGGGTPTALPTVSPDGSNLGSAVSTGGSVTSRDVGVDPNAQHSGTTQVAQVSFDDPAPSPEATSPARGARAARERAAEDVNSLPTRVLGGGAVPAAPSSGIAGASGSALYDGAQRLAYMDSVRPPSSVGLPSIATSGTVVAQVQSGSTTAPAQGDGEQYFVRVPRATDFTLNANEPLPVALVSNYSSEVAGGPIVFQVTQPITESIRHRDVVIPRLTYVTVKEVSAPTSGSRRARLAVQFFTFPDGSTMKFPPLVVGDTDGTGGMTTAVNDHRGAIFGTAGLTAVLSVIPVIATGGGGAVGGLSQQNAGQAAAGALSTQTVNAGTQIMAAQLKALPELSARDGREYVLVLDRAIPFAAPYAPYPAAK